jgi:hypothetical protein
MSRNIITNFTNSPTWGYTFYIIVPSSPFINIYSNNNILIGDD